MLSTLPRTGVTIFPREIYAKEYFDYRAGQHVVFGGPTRKGKTQLIFKLLEHVAHPEMPAYVGVVKPRDELIRSEGKRLGYRFTKDWPPQQTITQVFGDKPSGYIVWPKLGNMETDNAVAARVMATLMRERYAAGVKGKPGILVCDDSMIISEVLGLRKDMVTHLAMAGAMKLGGWYVFQKPTDSGKASVWSYGQSEFLFIFFDPDKRNRQRYGEIGGFDPGLIEAATMELEPYQCLALQRTGQRICVVDAQ